MIGPILKMLCRGFEKILGLVEGMIRRAGRMGAEGKEERRKWVCCLADGAWGNLLGKARVGFPDPISPGGRKTVQMGQTPSRESFLGNLKTRSGKWKRARNCRSQVKRYRGREGGDLAGLAHT